MNKDEYIESLQKQNKILLKTLEFYANPKTYHKMAFTFYRESGGFVDDFIKDKPGKLAKETINKIKKEKDKYNE